MMSKKLTIEEYRKSVCNDIVSLIKSFPETAELHIQDLFSVLSKKQIKIIEKNLINEYGVERN
tara:strand:+ start:264 stop:452 length:189 start_codon:yes stop_codon:yes gene_type:complete